MSGPTVQVFLDDGSGTYPIDVSSRVHLPRGVTVSNFGRGDDDRGQAQSAELKLTLDNTDGALSVGAGAISSGQRIRLRLTKSVTARNRFTGRITGGGLSWPGGQGRLSEMAVSAMDFLTDLGGFPMRSILEQEILLRSPSEYYTLGESAGSKTAGDTSGNQAAPLEQTGTGTAVQFGNGTGPADGLTAATFAGGKELQGVNDGVQLMPTTFGLTATFNTSQTEGFIASRRHYYLSIGLGVFQAVAGNTVLNCPTSVSDGHTHTAAVFGDGTTAYFVVDGVLVDSKPIVANNGTFEIPMEIGGNTDAGATPFTGTISHVAAFPALTVADAQAICQAAATGFAGETTAQRFARILAYTGLSGSTTTGMSGQTMAAQATSGTSALDALEAVAAAEGGLLYADGDGTIVLQGRGYRAAKTTPDLTLTADELDPDTDVTADNQQQIKQVTVTAVGGATQVVGSGLPADSLDLAVDNDGDALRAAQWIVAKHASPAPRMGSGKFDLMTSTNAANLLARSVGDRLRFTGLPSQMWPGAGEVSLEGWTETISQDAWTLDANLLPWSLFTALVLDDPVYGALDAYPIMN